MGVQCRVVASLLALSGAAAAIKPHMARATPVNQHYHEHGWTPKPTTRPKPLLELFKRQAEAEFCGYLEGDRSEPIACDPGSSCMYNEALNWFGCCTGMSITDCDVYTACVQRDKFDDCLSESSCVNDPLAMACTRRSMPYCATLYTVVSGTSYGHFVCDSTSTSYAVVSAATTGDNLSSFSPFATESSDDDSTTSRRVRPTQPTLTDVNTPPPRSRPTQPALFSSESSSESSTAPIQTPAGGTQTSRGPPVAPPSQTQSNAGALRTAEAVAGAVGGVAGLFAFFL